MKIQLALDVVDIKKATEICKRTKDYIDIIELGTPFIKQNGLERIKKFKRFKKPILADLKTMDTGFFESELAFKAGADFATVCGCSDNATIKGAAKAAKKYNKKTVADLISVDKVGERTKQCLKFGADFVGIHTGIDMQNKGISPFAELRKVSKIIDNKRISVAGGINTKNIEKIKKYNPEIIVVGGAITKARNPEKISRILREKCSSK